VASRRSPDELVGHGFICSRGWHRRRL
jgi:hypothetical protein